MDRLIVILSVLLFVTTWGFLIYIVYDELKPVHYAKDYTISSEISLSDKTADRFSALVDARMQSAKEKDDREREFEGERNSTTEPLKDLPIEYLSNEEGIPIDTLLELLDIEYETVPL